MQEAALGGSQSQFREIRSLMKISTLYVSAPSNDVHLEEEIT